MAKTKSASKSNKSARKSGPVSSPARPLTRTQRKQEQRSARPSSAARDTGVEEEEVDLSANLLTETQQSDLTDRLQELEPEVVAAAQEFVRAKVDLNSARDNNQVGPGVRKEAQKRLEQAEDALTKLVQEADAIQAKLLAHTEAVEAGADLSNAGVGAGLTNRAADQLGQIPGHGNGDDDDQPDTTDDDDLDADGEPLGDGDEDEDSNR